MALRPTKTAISKYVSARKRDFYRHKFWFIQKLSVASGQWEIRNGESLECVWFCIQTWAKVVSFRKWPLIICQLNGCWYTHFQADLAKLRRRKALNTFIFCTSKKWKKKQIKSKTEQTLSQLENKLSFVSRAGRSPRASPTVKYVIFLKK